jgi:antibiotic biosynthesis monooxygenase (ABM) superfamily enzyme
MPEELTLVVLLFVTPGQTAEFERFEPRAAEVMSRYGGRIERRIAFPAHDDPAQPDEVHVVRFPDPESFECYRRDPEMEALAELRARVIRKTIVWCGVDLPPFQVQGAR